MLPRMLPQFSKAWPVTSLIFVVVPQSDDLTLVILKRAPEDG